MTDRTKKAYSGYYEGMHTAIGGDERFQWVCEALLKGVKGKNIVDVGCGEGSLLRMLKDNGNGAFGIDASESGRASCSKKDINCAVIDISSDRFPLPDDSFDVALCLETLEHLENPHHCLWEIKRVLKDGGLFIASIPNPGILHPCIYPGLFELKNFREFLKLNSFEITGIRGWGQAGTLNRLSRWLKKSGHPIPRVLAEAIHYFNRKRNLVMRKHTGTPLGWSFSINFICVNRKKDKTLLEQLAEETCPRKGR